MPSTRSTIVEPTGFAKILLYVSRWAMYALFFFIPLFFLPWTTAALEINKQLFFVVVAVLGLGSWMGSMVLEKRLRFSLGWFSLLPLLFLVSMLVSASFSIAGYQTWVGQASQEYTSFLSVGLFVLLFYFVQNQAEGWMQQSRTVFVFFFSAALSAIITLFGAVDLVHLPFDFAQSTGFNTIGTINSFIAFLTVAMFTGMALWLISGKAEDSLMPSGGWGFLVRGAISVITLVNIILLCSVDFWMFWVVNIVGVVLLGVFAFLKDRDFTKPKRFILPIIILLVSITFLFLPSPLKLSLPVVVTPSYGMSVQVVKDTLAQNSRTMLFGSGPGTFLHDYLRHKPVTVNGSPFWSLRFDRAKSALLTQLATTGVVTTLLWIILMGWICVRALGRLIREREHTQWQATYVLFVGWAMLVILHSTYSTNFTLQFLLWGFTGLLAAQLVTKRLNERFEAAPRASLAVSAAFAVLGVSFIASLFFVGQRYAAEVAFTKAVRADQAEDMQIDEVLAHLSRATTLNPWSDVYLRNEASALFGKARHLIEQSGADRTDEQTREIASVVGQAIASAARATAIEQNYAPNWVMRGSIYRDVMSFAQNAEDLAGASFQNAITLEPINPLHRTNLGRVYLNVAARARALRSSEDPELAQTATERETVLLAEAEAVLQSAVEQKPDYAPAHYYLAAVYERQGRMEDAAKRLVALRNNSPTDVGLAFQLSVLLLRMQEYDLAQAELERITTLSPNYSNALWYLASAYELQGETDKAMSTVQRVLQLNPNNEAAYTRLERLKQGERTTAIPEPIQDGQQGITSVPTGEIVEEGSDDTLAEDDTTPEDESPETEE